jgi:hypothetical protein
MMKMLPPELVAPVVGLLAHRDCPVNGEEIFAAAGRVSRFADVRPREGDAPDAGFAFGPDGYANPDLTMEDLRDHWVDVVGPDYRPLVFPDESAGGIRQAPYVPSS